MRPLTPAEVALLHADDLQVSAGLELLNPDLSVREDVSDDLVGGKVSYALLNTIHRTCTLSIARRLDWLNDLVRPYLILSDGATTARFNMGVFCPMTPRRQVGETPETYEVSGQDRLYLLNRQIGRDWGSNQGTTYRQALLETFIGAGVATSGVLIEGSAADNVIPAHKLWPLIPNNQNDPDQTSTPVTWLRAINDLLSAINFRSVWADADGVYRCEAYRSPSTRPVEFTFSDQDVKGSDAQTLQTILGEDRTIDEDLYRLPNKWVAYANNPPEGVTPTEANGLIQKRDNFFGDPSSQIARSPQEWVSVLSYDAANATVLAALLDRRVAEDKASTTRFEVTVGPFPAAGHGQVFRYVDSAAGVDRRVQLIESTVDLTGDDTTFVWEAV